MNYKDLGFKCGLEVHQQIESHKLFCSCPSLVNDEHQPDIFFERKLRAAAGETGLVDKAAAYEMEKGKTFQYEACSSSSCLVEFDEEPPHPVNHDALKIALEVALLLHAKPVDEVHFMRKTVVDGSNVSGFQRTALIAVDGYVETSRGKVAVSSVCLEEEAAKKIEIKDDVVRFRLDRLGVALVEVATDASIQDPEHAKETAALLGMILRSTGKVKRGLGTIRQDVNLSITGHPRVELKGFQELRYMPRVIDEEVKRQQKEGKKGIAHVRRVNADGSSDFLRPMPGAARMYPETDIPVIVLSKELLQSIVLPELLDEKTLRFEKEYGLNSDVARMLVREDVVFELFLRKYPSLDASFIVQCLVSMPKEIQARFGLEGVLHEKDFEMVFGLLTEKKITKEAVLEILVSLLKKEKIDLQRYAPVDEREVEEIIRKIVHENKGAPINALMGEAMKQLRGKVDGKKVMELLKKLN